MNYAWQVMTNRPFPVSLKYARIHLVGVVITTAHVYLVSRGQTLEKGTSGHYCQHSVIQWNFINVTSRQSVTRKNVIAKRLHAGVNDYHQGLE